ncbi:MAG: hypothetical protein KAS32_18725 [Candidatus Peribacteraceae bacterium]|nr:hypothetical protein [Candidatus Peribacteraceae bacterium]
MKINICTEQNGNIYPAPYNVVNCIPDRCVFNQGLGINHPIAIYNISTKRVIDSFIALNDLILRASEESKKMEDDLIKAEIEMMEAMMAHIDDCYSIMMSLQPFNISMRDEK